MSRITGVVLSVLMVVASAAFGGQAPAQPDEVPFVEGQAPPSASCGDIWCLVTKPASCKTVTEQVLVRPATFYYETKPAVFETKTEEVVVEPEKKIGIPVPAEYKTEIVKKLMKEGSSRYEVVPAEYQMVDEVVQVKPEGEAASVQAQRYKTVTERVLVAPAHTEWRKVDCNEKGVIISRRESKDDCYTLCEIPARYETITKQVLDEDLKTGVEKSAAMSRTIKVTKLVKDAEIKKVTIPPEYQDVETQVLVKPASVRYETIPAKVCTISKQVMVKPEEKVRVDLPAKYETVTKEVIESPATMVWRRRKGEVVSAPAPKPRYPDVPGISSNECK